MNYVPPSLRGVVSAILKKVDAICEPNPKYTHLQSEQEIGRRRNKAIVFIYATLHVLFLLDMLINNGPVVDNLFRCLYCYLAIGSVYLSCRYHPQIFNWGFSFLCIMYGPGAMSLSPQGIYVAYFYAHSIPLFTYLFTRSFWYFILQVFGQYLLVNHYYERPLHEIIAFSSPSTVVSDLKYASIMTMGLQFTFIILVERFIEQAYHQALLFEQRKNQIEKQKIFLLGFSHELRNLINSLTGNVKLATLENITGRAKDFLSNAEVCGELLLHLVNNILDTGKAEIGELEINRSAVKTYDVFERIWGICSELIKRKDLKGILKIPKDLPQTLIIDHHRLTQIFLNLVGNSIKFTERGSIDITVEWMSNKHKVDEQCFQPYPFNSIDEHDEGLFEKRQDFTMVGDAYFLVPAFEKGTPGKGINKSQLRPPHDSYNGILKLTVRDTGCGMTKEQTDKLFQKFTQVTSDISKKKLGTGLGLFITRQLCERMDGAVRVFSQKGKGTYFVFCLPVETTQEAQSTDYVETMKTFLASKILRVMIVDDVLSNQIMLRNFFEKFSIPITDLAVNGVEAYHKYVKYLGRGEPLHIVAMDLDMPIMDGKEASQKIRELETERGLKPCFLLIISGNCVDSEIKECLDKNGKIRANAFLRKPIRMDDLIRIVVSSLIESEK